MNLNNAARTTIRRNARWLLRLTAFYAVHIRRNEYHTVPIKERTANNSSYEKSPTSSCTLDTNTYCHVYFGLKGRHVEISGVGESLENYYKYKAEEADHSSKNIEQTISKSTIHEPIGLPKWHEKVDPTQALLNSFVLPEDSPEIKGIFNGEIVSSSVIKPMENTL